MNPLTVEDKIQCLKNLLADPDDWISYEILRLADEDGETPEGSNGPVGINETSPIASKHSSKIK